MIRYFSIIQCRFNERDVFNGSSHSTEKGDFEIPQSLHRLLYMLWQGNLH